MTRALILAALLLAAVPARANEWSVTDMALEVSYAALHLADWSQTLGGVGDDRLRETNPILGQTPTRARVHLYMASTLILHAGVAYLLPRPWRTVFQLTTISFQAYVVGSNLTIGVRLSL